MRIIWDEPKRLANVLKHGFDFADLDLAFFEDAVQRPARSPRRFAFNWFEGDLLAVVYVRLGTEALAVISMRPANVRERQIYDQTDDRI